MGFLGGQLAPGGPRQHRVNEMKLEKRKWSHQSERRHSGCTLPSPITHLEHGNANHLLQIQSPVGLMLGLPAHFVEQKKRPCPEHRSTAVAS
ncbi:hypothetical protein NHX12_022636 [Muraenolepis orangiensis]|uniref:Uncharacterized protein n=1 Tax=Muraenolepis orangiensis TaxID=630683 RepID=A0A9Q0ENM0_9TELE|nr:hypothetical protein NHX12_022636 [Muraenolepis orangiensis]